MSMAGQAAAINAMHRTEKQQRVDTLTAATQAASLLDTAHGSQAVSALRVLLAEEWRKVVEAE